MKELAKFLLPAAVFIGILFLIDAALGWEGKRPEEGYDLCMSVNNYEIWEQFPYGTEGYERAGEVVEWCAGRHPE